MSSQRLLILGAVLGLVTVVLLNLYVSGVQDQQESVKVLRLRPDIALAKGDRVTRAELVAVGLPAEFDDLLQQAIPANGDAARWIQDRPATSDVAAGSLLLYSHFEDQLEERFSAAIADGMRALSIPVKSTSAVGYFVEPGSRVDILATMREVQQIDLGQTPPGVPSSITQPQVFTKTLLQNVKVLAVGRATTRGGYEGIKKGEFKDVTVEVTPLQAEKLVFALEHTEPRRQLTLVLRNPADADEVRLPKVNWKDLDAIQ